MSLHAARLHRSDRLRRVLRLLADGHPHSTLDIVRGAQVCAVNSIISELRSNGLPIRCRREGFVWYYQLGAPPTTTKAAKGASQ